MQAILSLLGAATRAPAAVLPVAAAAADDAALAAARSVLGPNAADDLVRFATKVDLEHVFAGQRIGGQVEGLHHAAGPGRVGDLTVDALNSSRKVTTTPPPTNATWHARIGAEGVQAPKQSVMFPTSWTRADVIDAVRQVHASAPKVSSPGIDMPGRYVQQGTARGIEIRVVGDDVLDRIRTSFPTRPRQVVTE